MNDILIEKYLTILKDIDEQFLNPDKKTSPDYTHLSGLFLPSVPDEYIEAKNKIMIIGRETKAWNVLKKEKSFTNINDYIKDSVEKHKAFFSSQLNRKNAKGSAFHNFTRSIANKCGESGLIYSNLFCFSFRNSNPVNSKLFNEIMNYSEQLLKAQIETLKPNIIIFANGGSTAKYRRHMFPVDGSHCVCSNFNDYVHDGIENIQLWHFDLYSKIKCYRIMHPSSYSKEAMKSRDFLIELLPPKNP